MRRSQRARRKMRRDWWIYFVLRVERLDASEDCHEYLTRSKQTVDETNQIEKATPLPVDDLPFSSCQWISSAELNLTFSWTPCVSGGATKSQVQLFVTDGLIDDISKHVPVSIISETDGAGDWPDLLNHVVGGPSKICSWHRPNELVKSTFKSSQWISVD